MQHPRFGGHGLKKIQPSAAAAHQCTELGPASAEHPLHHSALHHKEGTLKNTFMAFLMGQLGCFRERAGVRDLELSRGLSKFASVVLQPGSPSGLNKMEIKDCQSCK